ncbi:MAG: hypothetical protein H0W15_08580 [Gemmatimonadales bacterium]|nr:hypothetical protein [Gemmatimonadales bacterium]
MPAPSKANAWRRESRGGFALPMVILVTLVLTITVGAGLLLTAADHSAGTDHDAHIKAYTVAQTGLERYFTDVTALPTTFPDPRTITVPGGTANVTLHRMRAASSTDSAIYVLTSIGQATGAGLRRSSLTPVAERSVTQFATWQSGVFDANAAYTSLAAVNIKNGASGSVNGFNASGCPGGDVAGLALPDGTFAGKNDFISGTNGNTPLGIGTPGPAGTAKDSVGIDWAGILAGSLAPDYGFNSGNNAHKQVFKDAIIYANWPVVKINGDLDGGWRTPTGGGRGVLIVTGDADLSNIEWRGIALVGGATSFSGGSVNVFGALISGLNVQLGQTVTESTMNGNLSVQYNSCDIAQAVLKFGGWRRYTNSWSDNWPTYTVQ